MDDKYKSVYAQLSAADKKAFRRALAADDFITITAYMRAAGVKRELAPCDDLQEGKKRGRGRPELAPGAHSKQDINKSNKQFRNTKNISALDDPGGVPELSIEQFRDLYHETITAVCEQFYNEHPDIIKRPPFMWVNSLLLECKKQLPIIDIKDAQRVAVAWEAFTDLIYKVGLFPTMEAFTNLTGIYKETLNKQLTPEHEELRQKIFSDCRDNMLSQVSYNPMTQVNKLFLLKAVYGYSENGGARDLVAEKKTKKVNDIPLFSIEDKNENE